MSKSLSLGGRDAGAAIEGEREVQLPFPRGTIFHALTGNSIESPNSSATSTSSEWTEDYSEGDNNGRQICRDVLNWDDIAPVIGWLHRRTHRLTHTHCAPII